MAWTQPQPHITSGASRRRARIGGGLARHADKRKEYRGNITTQKARYRDKQMLVRRVHQALHIINLFCCLVVAPRPQRCAHVPPYRIGPTQFPQQAVASLRRGGRWRRLRAKTSVADLFKNLLATVTADSCDRTRKGLSSWLGKLRIFIRGFANDWTAYAWLAHAVKCLDALPDPFLTSSATRCWPYLAVAIAVLAAKEVGQGLDDCRAALLRGGLDKHELSKFEIRVFMAAFCEFATQSTPSR